MMFFRELIILCRVFVVFRQQTTAILFGLVKEAQVLRPFYNMVLQKQAEN